MRKIVIISPSVRKGRYSHRVALYCYNLIKDSSLAEPEILDLLEYSFPLFNERLKYQEFPSAEAIIFSEKIKSADGVIIISPEYNGSPPASLKNAVDLLTDEWRLKPVALISVSDGHYGGTQAIISLQFTFWKLGAITVPAVLRFPDINTFFDENGDPADIEKTSKKCVSFLKKLLWHIESKEKMVEKSDL
jgi:NAD(P)H-dependent FMN reductase